MFDNSDNDRTSQLVGATACSKRPPFLFLNLGRAKFTLILLLAGFARSVYGQAITQDIIIAPGAQVRQLGAPLEKVIGYFTSKTEPSIVVGFFGKTGGIYLYTSTNGSIAGPWKQTLLPIPVKLMSVRLHLLIPVTHTLA